MKKIDYRILYNPYIIVYAPNHIGSEKYHDLQYFGNERDAKNALKLYAKVKGIDLESSNVQFRIKTSIFAKGDELPHFKSLDEFIDRIELREKLGDEAIDRILAEIGVNRFTEAQERIIERMIRDYQYQIKINQNLPVDVESYKENVKFLEDLRDGKIELSK